MELTPKERVRRAMSLEEPDLVPVFPVITGYHTSKALGIPYAEVIMNPKLYYDLLYRAWELYRYDGFEVPLILLEDWREKYDLEKEGDITWVKEKGGGRVIGKIEDDDFVAASSEPPIKEESDLKKIKIIDCNDYLKSGVMEPIKELIDKIGDGAFLAGPAASQSMNFLVAQRGSQQAMLDLIDNPSFAKKIMAIGTERSIELGRAFIEIGIDGIYIGDAWASSSIISPQQYKEFCLPFHRKATEAFHKYGVKVYLHICGNCSPILDMMADTGVDAIEPLDPLGGVDIADAKRRVGDRVCLKGGVNTLTLLQGTPEDVRREVRYCIENAGRGGGLLVGSGDDIPKDSPVENVKAMVEEAHRWEYPL